MTTKSYECPLAPFSKHGIDNATCSEMCGASIAVKARYAAAGIPQDYQGIYLDNSPAKDDQPEVYKALEKYVETFGQEDVRIKNVYLFSRATGTGKSTSAAALLNEWIRRRFLYHVKKGEQVPEVLGLFLDVTEWQNEYNMAAMTKDDESMTKIATDIKRYSTVPFLVCDDIGVRGASEAFRGYLHTILNARTTNNLPTVYTSNEDMDSLATTFDQRLYDRVRDQTVVLAFKGESKRGRRTNK